MDVLIAIDDEDARVYRERFGESLRGVRSIAVSESRKAEGLRVTAVYATPAAHVHPDYDEMYWTLLHGYLLTTKNPPRVI